MCAATTPELHGCVRRPNPCIAGVCAYACMSGVPVHAVPCYHVRRGCAWQLGLHDKEVRCTSPRGCALIDLVDRCPVAAQAFAWKCGASWPCVPACPRNMTACPQARVCVRVLRQRYCTGRNGVCVVQGWGDAGGGLCIAPNDYTGMCRPVCHLAFMDSAMQSVCTHGDVSRWAVQRRTLVHFQTQAKRRGQCCAMRNGPCSGADGRVGVWLPCSLQAVRYGHAQPGAVT